MMKNLKRNWLVVSQLTWGILHLSIKNLHFNRLLLTKLYNVWARKMYRGVMFHDTRVWCKIWRKTAMWFGKWHEEFGKFSPEHTKVSKLELSLGPFIQSRKHMSLNTSGDYVLDNKEWFKIWKGIDLPVQIWPEEFNKFWPEHLNISKI